MANTNFFAILSLCVCYYANGVAIRKSPPIDSMPPVDPPMPGPPIDPPMPEPPVDPPMPGPPIDPPMPEPPVDPPMPGPPIDPPMPEPPVDPPMPGPLIDPPMPEPPVDLPMPGPTIDPPMPEPPIDPPMPGPPIDPPMPEPPIDPPMPGPLIDPPMPKPPVDPSTIVDRLIIDPPMIDPPIVDPPKTIKPVKPTPTGSEEPLDLAFIMDTTGSMSSYIHTARENIQKVVDRIVQSSRTDIRFALIEYRDHPPAESTFVVRKNDFTSSVLTMKSWLEKAEASGGGDTPEAVADALHSGTTLSWRPKAVKVAVLVSDAPPHGLDPSSDTSFPNGLPGIYDPIEMAHKLVGKGVTLYTVGCEPAISPYKDFFMALAYIASGQYIPLSRPKVLIDAIIGGAKEELSLQHFSADVQREIEKQQASGGTVDRAQIAQTVYDQLSSQNTKTTQLLRNDKPLEGPSSDAIAIAATGSMAEARKVFKKGSAPVYSSDFSIGRPSRVFSKMSIMGGDAFSGIETFSDMMESPYARMESMPMASSFGMESAGASRMASPPVASSVSAEKETYTAVDAAVTLEQIKRLVNKEAAKTGA
ncbi:uncharacterized protein LOC128232507 isoform X2 [Mya arenaria]|uniref:uncharacterized protein LOC128232507 isoform X2 n=1 Tax=Mya arenaria TaxID=6604 RepID=UPI0022E2EFA7|nr:uncharacterized protein LOC128232507 isoform X2 [Mya arenaria]